VLVRGQEQEEMGKGAEQAHVYTWEEVQEHSHKNDQWLVIDRKVYDVTNWAKRHPGGSEPFIAFHPDQTFVQKFLKPLLVGELATHEPSQDSNKNTAVVADLRELVTHLRNKGMFVARPWFFGLHMAQILLLEGGAWLLLWLWGTAGVWSPLSSDVWSVPFNAMSLQVQVSWLQHDLGHSSVFKTTSWNHIAQRVLMGHIKGVSAQWWNHRHFQHHAKPNVFSKDPDIKMVKLLVVGNVQPVEYGIKKIKFLPYHYQHKYFFLSMHASIAQRNWEDLAWALSFYLRYFMCYVPLYGVLGTMALLISVRFLESHWFVWVSQMSHLPMNIDHEKHKDWLSMQLSATCNVEQSAFNDWFTGHLNFRLNISNLFPTMPRHNYHQVAPLVKALCEKHGILYQEKSMGTAMADVYRSLKNSGELWLDAYLHK
uniref:Fatty acid desaturase 2 n=1 Tax=Neogobius melanostomus TaxID=47308 RepID=A0A8C6SXK8_9GOBI